jgi:hypothetical protein
MEYYKIKALWANVLIYPKLDLWHRRLPMPHFFQNNLYKANIVTLKNITIFE